MIKVILNALPPARIDTPSAALSVLKSFLAHHNFKSSIIYWNLILDRLLPAFERDTDAIHLHLLPYLYLISEEYQDGISKSKANAVMKAQLPIHDIRNDNSDYLKYSKDILDATVRMELSRLESHDLLLFGISCKYEQWISGFILARYIKEFFPQAKIVIGGLGSRDKAESIMQLCKQFDFAIWGEGEYPLLELCQAIESKTDNFNTVTRLLFRQEGALHSSDSDSSRFVDMNSRIIPDYEDYFRYREVSDKKNFPVIFPLESSRGCTWNSCKFCVYADGYENRKKSPEVLNDEINVLIEKYGAQYFAFMDNDIVANDHERFEQILDDLIAIKQKNNIHLIAEIIPKDIAATTIKKFPQAGLGQIHFGYESLSDRLLKKMGKKNNFSDNLFLVKFAQKYKIKLPSANIICGAIGEEDVDILECMDNLHFLRFYFDKKWFVHNRIPLTVARQSDFYKMIKNDELIKWGENTIFNLLPKRMVEGINRFSLFDFSAQPGFLWETFAKINDFYYAHRYSYRISMRNDTINYWEFFDGEPISEIALSELEYSILQETNANTMNLHKLLKFLKQKQVTGVEEGKVLGALDRLKKLHMIYFRDNWKSIISVIDTDQMDGLSVPGAELR